jgi:hypothetical protein
MSWEALGGVAALRPEWQLGGRFMAINSSNYSRFITIARLPMLAVSAFGGWLVFRWASARFGTSAGLFGALIWCFSPFVLAHGHLVTPDVSSAVAMVAAAYVFRRYLVDPTLGMALAVGITLGVAQLTKFTNVLLYLALGVVWLWWFFNRGRQGISPLRAGRKMIVVHSVVAFVISILVLNAGYLFDGTCQPLGSYQFMSETLAGPWPVDQTTVCIVPRGNRFVGTWLEHIPVPLPREYLSGIDLQKAELERGRLSYLAGELRHGGWWYYNVWAVAVKATVPFLLLMALSTFAYLCCRGKRQALWEDALLFVPPLLVAFVVSSQSGFSEHLRYLLPAMPFCCVWASRVVGVAAFWKSTAGTPALRSTARVLLRSGVLLLGMWHAAAALLVRPHYLSYFNELAGGPTNGSRFLAGSSIDWGQDLLHLKSWLDRHPRAGPVRVAYWGTIDPSVVGIDFQAPVPYDEGEARLAPTPRAVVKEQLLLPGLYAVSVNYLVGLPFQGFSGPGRPASYSEGVFTYFRRLTPIARAGYSIYIYHITLEDANRVRREMGLPELTPEDVARARRQHQEQQRQQQGASDVPVAPAR